MSEAGGVEEFLEIHHKVMALGRVYKEPFPTQQGHQFSISITSCILNRTPQSSSKRL